MFPDQNFSTIGTFMDAYHEVISIATSSVDCSQMQRAATLLIEAYKSKHFVWVCGNGGSASIANHLVCDHAKGARSSTNLRPRVTSLVSNMEIVTAISNDISYDDIFAYQLENLAQTNDILIMISSSGDSENIIKACDWANKNKVSLIVTTKPDEAVKNSDCVMTDKWISMNDKVNKKSKKKILKPYQVNKKLMNKANENAIFMHCLPVGRGEEVTDEIIDGKKSVVWRQALNRVHAQKSIIKWCLD